MDVVVLKSKRRASCAIVAAVIVVVSGAFTCKTASISFSPVLQLVVVGVPRR